MNIKISELNKRINIVRNNITVNENGFEEVSESVIASIWAKVQNMSGNEMFKANTDYSKMTTRFIIRYTKDLTTEDYIIFNNNKFNIVYINNYNYSNEFFRSSWRVDKMNVDIDFSDLDKLQKRLDDYGRKGSILENKALLAGAEVINNEIINNAPERTGKAKSFLKVSKVTKEKGIKIVKVGISKEDNSEAFYLKFHEYGTSKMTARPFMRPAFEKKRKQALEVTHKVIKEGLGL